MHRGRRLIAALAALALVAVVGAAGTVALRLPAPKAPPTRVARISAPAPSTSTPAPSASTPGSGTPWVDPLAAVRAAYTPVRLQIPTMGLDSTVIPVGLTPQGAMATPLSSNAADPIWEETYWWSGGVVPGQTGNAVIAGHVNRSDGSAASFTDLHGLQAGDPLEVTTANGTILDFEVVNVEHVSSYANGPGDPTLSSIFGPSTTRDLNLVTCAGEWDGKMYNQRLVVRARLVGTDPLP